MPKNNNKSHPSRVGTRHHQIFLQGRGDGGLTSPQLSGGGGRHPVLGSGGFIGPITPWESVARVCSPCNFVGVAGPAW